MHRTRIIVGLLSVAVVAIAVTPGPAVAQSSCSYPYSATDATGTDVTISDEPASVVVLAPSAAQTMWEIGAKDKVEGLPINTYTSDLDGYNASWRTQVVAADLFSVLTEEVIDLNPDLVLAPNVTPKPTIQTLRDAGLQVYHFKAADSLEDIEAKTSRTGKLVGACEGADQTVAWMNERQGIIRDTIDDVSHPIAYYPMGGGWTAGEQTFIHHVISNSGVQNVGSLAGIQFYDIISDEFIVEKDPKWLIINEGMPVPESDAVQQTTAVKADQIIRVNPNYLNQPAPRVILVMEKIAMNVHPLAFERSVDTVPDEEPIDDVTVTSPTVDDPGITTVIEEDNEAQREVTGPTNEETIEETTTPAIQPRQSPSPGATEAQEGPTQTSASGPGFGGMVGMVALLLSILARFHRR